jgi:ATP-binding cassette subfamily F protein uup
VGKFVGVYRVGGRHPPQPFAAAAATPKALLATKPEPFAAPAKRKLGYKDARELEQLPARIEALETRLADMAGQMNDPAFYQRDSAAILAHNTAIANLQVELDAAYARWAELDG